MTDWKPQVIQVVWFSQIAHRADAAEILNDVFRIEAATTQRAAMITPRSPFFSVAEATHGGNVIRVMVQPNRIDLYIQPYQDPEAPVPLAVLADGESAFADIMARLTAAGSGKITEVVRLAVLLTLLAPTASMEEATDFACAAAGLPFRRADGYTDVMLQANRRRASKSHPELEFNRLLRIVSLEAQQLFVSPHGSPMNLASLPAGYASQWLIDLNTTVSPMPLDNSTHADIFGEMFAEVVRIQQAGSFTALQE